MSDAVNDFTTDTHRRVVGNLTQPRSARELARFLERNDPHVAEDAYTENGVESYLKDLEAEGLVKRIGSFPPEEVDEDDFDAYDAALDDAAKALLDAIKGDKAVPNLVAEKADALRQRAAHEEKAPYLDEDLWYWTDGGRAKLTGPIPDEPPPLTGKRLRAAKREQAAWHKENRRVERERREEEVEKRRKALEEAEKLLKETPDD